MEPLSCEICGGKLIAKAGGVFECAGCGLQYDKERVREMAGQTRSMPPAAEQVTAAVPQKAKRSRTWMLFAVAVAAVCATVVIASSMLGKKDTESVPVEVPVQEATEPQREHTTIAGGFTDVYNDYVIGIMPDGTVSTYYEDQENQPDVTGWTNMVSVSIANDSEIAVGLKEDGTVLLAGTSQYGTYHVEDWTEIVQICTGTAHAVGLKRDGTVVATGYNEWGQCEVSQWQNIKQIAAGYGHTVGLREDGTVVVAGEDNNGETNVSSWTDIVKVAAGATYVAGLKSDGTVVVAGYLFTEEDPCPWPVNSWENIVDIGGAYGTLWGVTADGRVINTWNNMQWMDDDVAQWRDVVAVNAIGCSDLVFCMASDGTLLNWSNPQYNALFAGLKPF